MHLFTYNKLIIKSLESLKQVSSDKKNLKYIIQEFFDDKFQTFLEDI